MALTPTIPTSFVPHQGSGPGRRFQADFGGAFGFFAYGFLILVFALSIGVFFYGRILAASQASKDAALQAAEASIDTGAAERFIRLRDRLSAGKGLLDTHVSLIPFFGVLETLTPSTVRFKTMRLLQDDKGVMNVTGTGVAKSFNSLAVISNELAKDGRVKNAIFSNISVSSTNGSVSFAFSATLDPKLVVFSPEAAAGTGASTSTDSGVPQTP